MEEKKSLPTSLWQREETSGNDGRRGHRESGGKMKHLTALMDIPKFDSYNPSRVLKGDY
jgi:hypothetical protein